METSEKEMLSSGSKEALLAVDIQVDFLPGGALGVKNGDRIIPPVNRAIAFFSRIKAPVFFSRDWHPSNHCSFQPDGGPWPPHCIQDTPGAAFSPDILFPGEPLILSKGTKPAEEQYSAFDAADATGRKLHDALMQLEIKRVWIGGLATDYCVLNTSLDLLKAGFQVVILLDACSAIDAEPGDRDKALARMSAQGAILTTTDNLESR